MIILIVDAPNTAAMQIAMSAMEASQRGIVIVSSSEQIPQQEPFETFLFKNFYQDIEALQRDIYEYIDFSRPAYPNVQLCIGIELDKVSSAYLVNPNSPTRGTP